LPDRFQADAWKVKYKGDDNKGYPIFEGIGFSISPDKMPDELSIGNKYEIAKLTEEDGTPYNGDGIVQIRNLKTNTVGDIQTWREKRKIEEIREKIDKIKIPKAA
jgi:hypothetical protein